MRLRLYNTLAMWILLCILTRLLYFNDTGLLFIPLVSIVCMGGRFYQQAVPASIKWLFPSGGGYLLIGILFCIYILLETHLPFNLLFQALGILSIIAMLGLFRPLFGYSLQQPLFYTSIAAFPLLTGITELLHTQPGVQSVFPYFYILICLWQLSIFLYLHLLIRQQPHIT